MSRSTTTVSVKCQAQTGSTFMCLRLYRNNFMLRSVYSRSLVNLNKSCVRVPLVIILPDCELNHCFRDGLKKALEMVCEQFHSKNFHKPFEGLFIRKYSNPTSGTLTIYIFSSSTLPQLLFSKLTSDLK